MAVCTPKSSCFQTNHVGIRPWANNIGGSKGTLLGVWVEILSWIFKTLDGYQSDCIFKDFLADLSVDMINEALSLKGPFCTTDMSWIWRV
jgi:hypothetical protein